MRAPQSAALLIARLPAAGHRCVYPAPLLAGNDAGVGEVCLKRVIVRVQQPGAADARQGEHVRVVGTALPIALDGQSFLVDFLGRLIEDPPGAKCFPEPLVEPAMPQLGLQLAAHHEAPLPSGQPVEEVTAGLVAVLTEDFAAHVGVHDGAHLQTQGTLCFRQEKLSVAVRCAKHVALVVDPE